MLKIAIAGLGGFAAQHHAAVTVLETAGECRLVATCDPNHEAMGEAIARHRLLERGARVYRSLDDLLASEKVDVITLPTPIPLHAAQHAAVVSAGAGCYLEKPPTLWPPEYRSMMEVEENAPFQTQVGFNFVGDPFRHRLRDRMRANEFGALREALFFGYWPRNHAYYTRNDWAGRRQVNRQWVLDSPIGNATAHYVQNLLFWAGEGMREVRACLMRAHPIEHFDTAFVEADFGGGAKLRLGVTHTGAGGAYNRETVRFEGATLIFDSWRSARILHADGTIEVVASAIQDQEEMLCENLRRYLRYIRGEAKVPYPSLRDSGLFVTLNHLVNESAGEILDISPTRVQSTEDGYVEVDGLENQLTDFVNKGTWPT